MKKTLLLILILLLNLNTFSRTTMKINTRKKKVYKRNNKTKTKIQMVKKGEFIFKNAERVFEDEWDLNFTKGNSDIFFRMPIRQINRINYNFISLRNGEPSSNRKLEKSKFYIEYTEKKQEDENTGGMITVRKIKKMQLLKLAKKLDVEKETLTFTDAEHIFEDVWDLNFLNGAKKLYFRLNTRELSDLNYQFIKSGNERLFTNKKLKRRKFYIEYVEKEEKDENTGRMITLRKIKKMQLLKEEKTEIVKKDFLKFGYADRIFEDEWNLNFSKGNKALFFRMTVEEITDLKYRFLKTEEGEFYPNKKLRNKKFYVEYTEEEKEDENTGEMITVRKIKKISLNTGKYSNAGIDKDYIVDDFIKLLKKEIKRNNKSKIAHLIDYPVKGIKNRREFIASYNKIFTKKFKNSILNRKKTFCNYNGVMLGTGEIWLNLVNGKLKITTIN